MTWIGVLILTLLLVFFPERSLEDLPGGLLPWGTVAILLLLLLHHRKLAATSGENLWTSPAPLLLGWVLLRYGMAAVVVYYWDQYEWEVPNMERRFLVYGARQNLHMGCALTLLGGLGMYSGFRLPVGGLVRMLPDVSWPMDIAKLQRNVLLYAPVGLVLLLFVIPRMPLSIQFAVSLFATITYALIAMVSYWWASAKGAARVRWGIATAGICGFASLLGLLSGQIGQVFVPSMMVMLGYTVARGRPPLGVLVPVGLAVFFLLCPFLTIYKYSQHSAGIENPTVEDRLRYTQERLSMTSYRAGVELAVDRFVARLCLIEFPSVFSIFYPHTYPLAAGHSFLVEFSSLIPRFLWPDKPQMSPELNRYTATVGMVKEDDGTSAVFDAFTEYYVNFGRLGVFLLAALHALYLKVLYHWLISLDWLAGTALHLMVFLLNFDFFGVGQMFVAHTKLIPASILILYVLGRRSSYDPLSQGVQYART
jgi:hypothetical protein